MSLDVYRGLDTDELPCKLPLVHLLLRFLAWRSRWAHSFTRLFTFVRAALWLRRELAELLRRCGTADGDYRCLDAPTQSELPGFGRLFMGQHA